LEPYFHRVEKEMDYRTEVEHALLQLIMETKINDMNFDDIIKIINETLNEQNGYKSESIEELGSKVQIKHYGDVLKKCTQFNEYKANNGRDIREEGYQKSWELIKQIYENNLEDRIDVTYKDIREFIEKVIRDGAIPNAYDKYITNLRKLKVDLILPIVA
jgi:Na+/phosphate symporter